VRINFIHQIAMRLFVFALLLASSLRTAPAQQSPLPQKSQPQPAIVVQAAARFRVTLNGFSVNNQSDDDILEGDGKGDEIYLRADVWQMDRSGAVVSKKPYKTPVLGDVNNQPSRKQAGSASNKGGLRTNDKYPTDQPWARGALQTLELPMLLWMGTLTQGEDGVLIVPTAWEWDSPNASTSEINWDNKLDPMFAILKPHLIYRIQNRVKETAFDVANVSGDPDVLRGGAMYLGRGESGTRPIGAQMDRIPLLPTQLFLHFQILPLNYDSALEATKTSPSNNGLGVFAFRYTDAQDHGDYTIYIQVEKVN
jgi:hypothetical protein